MQFSFFATRYLFTSPSQQSKAFMIASYPMPYFNSVVLFCVFCIVLMSHVSSSLKLFGFPGSSTANRVRIALAIKKIPYEFVLVDFKGGEHLTAEYAKTKNPINQIPILELDDGTLLRQSLPIIEYLEEAYPSSPSLLPLAQDPVARARVREVAEIFNSFIQPLQNKIVVEKVATLDPEFAKWLPLAVKAHLEGAKHESDTVPDFWPQQWICKGFSAVEKLLDNEGPYCFGDTVTLADCCVVPQVIGAKLYQIPVEEMYPKVWRVFQAVTALESVKEGLHDILSKL